MARTDVVMNSFCTRFKDMESVTGRLKKSLILTIVGIIVVAVRTFALSQPRELVNPISVTTDKSYYQTGNPATIMVTIHVKPQVYKEGEREPDSGWQM